MAGRLLYGTAPPPLAGQEHGGIHTGQERLRMHKLIYSTIVAALVAAAACATSPRAAGGPSPAVSPRQPDTSSTARDTTGAKRDTTRAAHDTTHARHDTTGVR